MTISILPTRSEYTAAAGQTVFSYTFKIFESTDLNVYITPDGQEGNDTTDITTNYTVTGLGDEAGGTIILNSGATLNDLITIASDIPESRTTDYQVNGDFIPETVNNDFDRIVSMVKQHFSQRVLTFQESTQGVSGITIDLPQANKGLMWNDDATKIINSDDDLNLITESAVLSQLKAWESEAEALTSDSYATEPEDTLVKSYASNEDGTFTVTNTNEYSSLHWAAKSSLAVPSVESVAQIEALLFAQGNQVSLSGTRAGLFVFDISDLSAEVSGDAQQGIYVAPTADATGADGAWVRQYEGAVKASWFGFSSVASGTVNSNAIQAALDRFTFFSGGTVELPRGNFDVAPDIIDFDSHSGTELRGVSPGYGYIESFPGTKLTFSVGSIGISMIGSAGATYLSCADNRVSDLRIDGSDVLTCGIKLHHNQIIEDTTIVNCVDYGVWLADLTNSAILNRLCFFDNTAGLGYGVYINGNDTTAFTLSNVIIRQNNIGMRVEAGSNVRVESCVIESNYQEGLSVYRPLGAATCDNYVLQNVWFENNNRTAVGYAVTFDAGSTLFDGFPSDFRFNDCFVMTSAGRKNVHVQKGSGIHFSGKMGDVTNGVLLNSTYARYVYNSANSDGGIDPAGRNWSFSPTALIPGGIGATGGEVNNRKYQLAKKHTQAANTGPETIFTISNVATDDVLEFNVSVAGIFPGLDYGYANYKGFAGGGVVAFGSKIELSGGGVAITISGVISGTDVLIQLTTGGVTEDFSGVASLDIGATNNDLSIL